MPGGIVNRRCPSAIKGVRNRQRRRCRPNPSRWYQPPAIGARSFSRRHARSRCARVPSRTVANQKPRGQSPPSWRSPVRDVADARFAILRHSDGGSVRSAPAWTAPGARLPRRHRVGARLPRQASFRFKLKSSCVTGPVCACTAVAEATARRFRGTKRTFLAQPLQHLVAIDRQGAKTSA
jgi:hypothetical protein